MDECENDGYVYNKWIEIVAFERARCTGQQLKCQKWKRKKEKKTNAGRKKNAESNEEYVKRKNLKPGKDE